jgi:pimeloyl-ACP methyl ester carboxylesterase
MTTPPKNPDLTIPIILLHGYPFDKSMWVPQMEAMTGSYRMLPLDIRGFGAAADETTPLSIALFADDLIAFMDSMHLGKAIVCGLSMGGFIALNAIQRYPDRIAALILCDTQCIADTKEVRDQRYATIKEIEANGAAAFNEAFITSVFHKDTLETKKDLVDGIRRVVFANSDRAIIRGLAALAERTETCTALPSIRIPTLILCGRDDGVTPLTQSEMMHTEIHDSILRVINGAGHLSNLEQPMVFNTHLLEFLMGLKK